MRPAFTPPSICLAVIGAGLLTALILSDCGSSTLGSTPPGRSDGGGGHASTGAGGKGGGLGGTGGPSAGATGTMDAGPVDSGFMRVNCGATNGGAGIFGGAGVSGSAGTGGGAGSFGGAGMNGAAGTDGAADGASGDAGPTCGRFVDGSAT